MKKPILPKQFRQLFIQLIDKRIEELEQSLNYQVIMVGRGNSKTLTQFKLYLEKFEKQAACKELKLLKEEILKMEE